MPVLPPNITPPVFYPQSQTIAAITNSLQAVITTTLPHGYKDFLIVRLNIPLGFGMQQANQVVGIINILNTTQFRMALNGPNGLAFFNTSQFDQFIIPIDYSTPAQVVPIGEIAEDLENVTKNILPL